MEEKLKDHTQFNIGSCKRLIEHNFRTKESAEKCLDFLKEQGFRIETILAGEKLAGMPYDRKCLRCKDVLRVEDDLICGYHNLEN